MPARYVLHPEARFVEEVLEGEVTLAELCEMLGRLFADPGWDPRFDGLVDITAGHLRLEADEIAAIARQLSNESAASRGRWAFVVTSAVDHGLVRMFTGLSEKPPREVRIFESRREAVEWLVTPSGAAQGG